MRTVWVLVVVAGCYRPAPPAGAPCNERDECPSPLVCDQGVCRAEPLGGDAPSDGSDGSIEDGPGDTMADAGPSDGSLGCDEPVTGTFSAPTVISLSSPAFDGTPTLSSDQLEVYIKSMRPGGMGGMDIWRSTRATIGSSWTTPTNVTEINSSSDDTGPELSSDGLTLWFSSTRSGGFGSYDIWRTTRNTLADPWTAPVHVPELSSPVLDEGIFITASRLEAYFQSERDGLARIYRATRTSPTAAWSAPAVMADLPVRSENPWLSPDGCALYFSHRPSGGNFDIVVATRATPTGTFGAPTSLAVVNANFVESDPWLSPDQRTLLFVSDRSVSYDIFEATR